MVRRTSLWADRGEAKALRGCLTPGGCGCRLRPLGGAALCALYQLRRRSGRAQPVVADRKRLAQLGDERVLAL